MGWIILGLILFGLYALIAPLFDPVIKQGIDD